MLAELDFMIMIDFGQISKWKSKEAFNCFGVQYTIIWNWGVSTFLNAYIDVIGTCEA